MIKSRSSAVDNNNNNKRNRSSMNPMTVRRFCFHVWYYCFPVLERWAGRVAQFYCAVCFFALVSHSIPLFSPRFTVSALVILLFAPSRFFLSSFLHFDSVTNRIIHNATNAQNRRIPEANRSKLH